MPDDDDMIGDDKPDVEVDEEEASSEAATGFVTKGLGWSGRDDQER